MKQTVLIYMEQNNKFLMLYRNKKKKDINKNKYIGIGGHVESNETPDQAVIREVKEETGLDLLSFNKSGIVYFILNGYKEEMHVYTSSDFKGELIECNEGELSWIDKDKILSLELWEGDKYFLNKILNKESGYVISLYYEDDKLLKVIE
jgi:8-oxo-dGTP diphosphatase